MAQTQQTVDQISGLNIYIDSKKRTIYYNPLRKKAWYVPKYDFKKFQMYKMRYMAAIAATLVGWTILNDWFKLPMWVAFAVGLLVWAWMEYGFYKFQNGLQPVRKFDKSQLKSTFDMNMNPEDKSRNWVKIALYVILGVLLVFNAYDQGYAGWTLYACWFAGILCCCYAIFLVYMMLRKPKETVPAVKEKSSQTRSAKKNKR